MTQFWMYIVAAQNAALTESANGRHDVVSIIGGTVLGLFIGAGLFIVAALNP